MDITADTSSSALRFDILLLYAQHYLTKDSGGTSRIVGACFPWLNDTRSARVIYEFEFVGPFRSLISVDIRPRCRASGP